MVPKPISKTASASGTPARTPVEANSPLCNGPLVSPITIAATLELNAGTVSLDRVALEAAMLDSAALDEDGTPPDDDSGAEDDTGAEDEAGAEEDSGAEDEAGAVDEAGAEDDSHGPVGKKLPRRMLPACTSTWTKQSPSAAASSPNRMVSPKSGPTE
jgi:hypothetical protein